MARLSKAVWKKHNSALEILQQDILSEDDKEFVYENFHEGAGTDNSYSGAFFTSLNLAYDFALDAVGDRQFDKKKKFRILDLCAGIGALSYAVLSRYSRNDIEIVCVEGNIDFVNVGKKLLPEATWVCADVADKETIEALGHFDLAISNPPFGRVGSLKHSEGYQYTGSEGEYKVLDIASVMANEVSAIVPQVSANFKYSGGRDASGFTPEAKYTRFASDTGIELESGMGIDTTLYGQNFKGVSIIVELVHFDARHIPHPLDVIETEVVEEALEVVELIDDKSKELDCNHLDVPNDAIPGIENAIEEGQLALDLSF